MEDTQSTEIRGEFELSLMDSNLRRMATKLHRKVVDNGFELIEFDPDRPGGPIQDVVDATFLRRFDFVKRFGEEINSIDLTERDMQGVSLKGFILKGSHFSGSNMIISDLRNVHAEYTVLLEADARWSDWSSAVLHNSKLCGSYLCGTNLSNCDLSECDLTGVDLRGVNAQGADFTKADLSGCDFRGSNLRDAKLNSAQFSDTDFSYCDMRGCELQDIDCNFGNYFKTDFDGAKLPVIYDEINWPQVPRSEGRYRLIKWLSEYTRVLKALLRLQIIRPKVVDNF